MNEIENNKQNNKDERAQNVNYQPLMPEEEPPFGERLKETIEKMRPYFLRLWKLRWRFIYVNGTIAIITILYLLFLTKPYYDSTVTILPDYGNKVSGMLSQLSGLASLAGVSVGKAASTEIYQNLITSEAVLRPVIYTEYKTKKFNKPVNLIQYFEIEPDESLPDSLRKRKMFLTIFKNLSNRINTNIDRMTKILTITVKMPEAELSANVVNNIAKSLNQYVLTQRKSFAIEQKKYLDKRIAQVKDSLSLAENNLKNFRIKNRMVVQSPSLMLEQARLARVIEIKQTVYIELMKQYELVKLEVVRDTPVINLREYAKDPIKKAGPKRLISLIIIMFFSSIISGFILIYLPNIKEYWEIIKGNEEVKSNSKL